MATVIGKTSANIDALLGDLVTTGAIVDGNLILTTKDGTQINAGSVGNQNSVTRLVYTSGAYPSRPVGVLCVEWIGPVQPASMTNRDTWVQSG